MKDENQPFKPRRRRSRGAGGVGGLVGRDNLLRLPSPQRRRPPAHRRRTGVRRPPRKRTGRSSLLPWPQERERDRPRTRTPPSRRTTCWTTPQQPAAQQGSVVGGDAGSSARAARAREPSTRQPPNATGGERPSPQITKGRSDPLPT
jgi:hypothetical protein